MAGGFDQQSHTRARGQVGEDAAADWLRRQGYRIVARNMVNKAGEIDIIARDGEVLCFIEVKARASDLYGPAVAAVGARKQRQVGRVATLYLARHPTDAPCRFDVLGMDRAGDRWRFTLVKDAFMLPQPR